MANQMNHCDNLSSIALSMSNYPYNKQSTTWLLIALKWSRNVSATPKLIWMHDTDDFQALKSSEECEEFHWI